MKILSILLALIYALFPYDLLPDFLVGWGWLDDILILGMLWYYLSRRKGLKQTAKQWFGNRQASGNTQSGGRDGRTSSEQERHDRDPYTVLGVSPHASEDEIKSAYRRLVRQYHPDKVAHLGDEFRQLAEKRFKEIQQAYQQIMPSK